MRSLAATTGLPGAFLALALMEAGVPLPVPIDLILLVLGERSASLHIPFWLTAAGIEAVAIVGTGALFLGAGGPASSLVTRAGGRLGLTQRRLGSARDFLERRGRPALFLGRATPGLRTATVVAAASAGLAPARALPALVGGSTLFLQGHLVLGYWLGPAALRLLSGALIPALLALAAIALVGLVVWLRRRGRAGVRRWTEASCPLCLAITLAGADARGLGSIDAVQ